MFQFHVYSNVDLGDLKNKKCLHIILMYQHGLSIENHNDSVLSIYQGIQK